MTHVNGSNWTEFVKDSGDALGGIFLGYAIGQSEIGYGIMGALFILLSLYLRFYERKSPKNEQHSTTSSGTSSQEPVQ